jgi:hypothetical protein
VDDALGLNVPEVSAIYFSGKQPRWFDPAQLEISFSGENRARLRMSPHAI